MVGRTAEMREAARTGGRHAKAIVQDLQTTAEELPLGSVKERRRIEPAA